MPEIETMIETLKNGLKKRFQDIQENPLATILDPRFKKFGLLDENKYKREVKLLYNKVANTKLVAENNSNIIEQQEEVENIEMETVSIKNDLLSNLWNEFDVEVQRHLKPTNTKASAIIEVDKYIEEPILARKDTKGIFQDHLLWWHQRKHIYPKLYQIMKTRLNIMATSVPCERIFSKAGQIVSERRERLKTDKISQVIFLNYNLRR
ncbi:unnamed protein product [Brassicogethes aeneus]|uniref:HAT C-terminal dimerisation domain-containing protein n=1 Tax=Brassicogethes aeneus TaxID=1431903 RepID=A0A9P0FHJ5_BRAAE|nr:unnamed protein product [Brassicogethes aeneus]